MNDAPVLIVDDDVDDRQFLIEAWRELNYANQLLFFGNGEEVLAYLKKEKTPFLILCDVNLPKINGFELKEKILENKETNYKSIPFVFWSTQVSKSQIQKAYDLGGNGFFVKGSNFDEIKQSLINIVNYWRNSKAPE